MTVSTVSVTGELLVTGAVALLTVSVSGAVVVSTVSVTVWRRC